MSNETIIQTVRKACEGRCQIVDFRQSATNSLYFAISNGNAIAYFRISDHPTHRKTRGFTVSKNTKRASVERYVESSIKWLERRSLCMAFEKINAKAIYA